MSATWTGEPVGSSPAPDSAAQTCTCGHPRDAHEHYRPGSDCSACPTCTQFRTAARLRDRFAQLFRRPGKQHRDEGLSALLDAVMTEQGRPACGCLACQVDYDEDTEPTR